MNQHQTDIKQHHIITDDLSFSAFLRLKGHPLIKIDSKARKSEFVFDISEQDAAALKMEFINSEFVSYYNELRNLKKLL